MPSSSSPASTQETLSFPCSAWSWALSVFSVCRSICILALCRRPCIKLLSCLHRASTLSLYLVVTSSLLDLSTMESRLSAPHKSQLVSRLYTHLSISCSHSSSPVTCGFQFCILSPFPVPLRLFQLPSDKSPAPIAS
jgi:hypothetical protein